MRNRSSTRRFRLPDGKAFDRALVTTGVGILATAAAVTGLAPGTSAASSHREAPLISGDPRADNTDVYAFTSPDKPDTVTLVANWIPFEEPNGGPNFYPFAEDARYNIKIDSDGDGRPDTTYTWTFRNRTKNAGSQFLYNKGVVTGFDDPDLLFKQTYDLRVTRADGRTRTLLHNAPVAPSRVGPASMPDYGALRDQAVRRLPGGGKAFSGQSDDSFFLDLRVFDLLYGGDLSERGKDTLAGYNVNTLAVQVPKKHLALEGDAERNPVIGVWSTTDRKGASVLEGRDAQRHHGYRQVSRLGNPLVNEVVVPRKYKDAFNSISPDQDRTVQPVVDKVYDPILPKTIEKVYGVPAPETPRDDLAEIYLTGICKACGPIKADLNAHRLNKDADRDRIVPAEELRLNMGVAPAGKPDRLGVLGGDLAGFPNGRRLTDDVVDISLQAVEGAAQTGKPVEALADGDRVDANDRAFGNTFPYVALPHTKSVNDAGSGGGARPSAAEGDRAGFLGVPQEAAAPAGLAALGALLLGAGGLRLRRRGSGRGHRTSA
ncbi:DUF4331 domain-containing protein [Streptomyces qinglanensis]|uniref:DUF4331 domain-containing protein n=1 Tax=Streptomyces qinglanensis TaxID=943816 RepID=UPI0037934116